MKMIPKKLEKGDEIRVVALSRSLKLIDNFTINLAIQRLTDLGFKLTFGKNVKENDMFNSSSIQSRISDFHEAIKDSNVKGILTVIGGFNSNQLLKYLDFDLIRANPKVICGYSDITAIQNALLAKLNLVTYTGPHFSTFGMKSGFSFIEDSFKKCLMLKGNYELAPSEKWSNDAWYLDQENRKYTKNSGWIIVNSGKAEARLVGGNLSTLCLLKGTEFFPNLNDSILLIEDDDEQKAIHFDRLFQSLLHLDEFAGVKGIIIGRFQPTSDIDLKKLKKILATKAELKDIPIVCNFDVGHTYPITTLPIGGKLKMDLTSESPKIEVLEH